MADGARIAVIGGKTTPFFAKIKKGVDDATLTVKVHGGSVKSRWRTRSGPA
jgi:simple sugar transport system substrate-binding protein